jgi:hypothetical protein
MLFRGSAVLLLPVFIISLLLFRFHVRAQNNRSYFLFVGDKVWFLEYGGQL